LSSGVCILLFPILQYLNQFEWHADAFWEVQLTAERAFLIRVFVQHAISTKDESSLETALPVVTALAFRIQSTYNRMLQLLQERAERRREREEGGEGEDGEVDDAHIEQEFVLGEMLRLAVDLDYGDEIGRRKMFQLVREWSGISLTLYLEVLPADGFLIRRYDIARRTSRGPCTPLS
jgi:condensin complex subunit 3